MNTYVLHYKDTGVLKATHVTPSSVLLQYEFSCLQTGLIGAYNTMPLNFRHGA